MTKTLKQFLEETHLKVFQDIDEPTHYEKSWVKIKTLEAVKDWLTQKRQKIEPLQKGDTFTDGKNKMIDCGKQFMLKELLEELQQ